MGRDAVEVNKEPEEREAISQTERAQEEREEGKLQKHHHAAISEAWVAMPMYYTYLVYISLKRVYK